MIQSHEIPERVIVKDNIKYRVNVQEDVTEDTINYTYETVEFPIGTPTEVCERKVAKYLIGVGNIEEAKFSVANSYREEHRAKWDKAKREEYNSLFPDYYIGVEESEELGGQKTIWYQTEVEIPIDYSEDENYVSYEDWLNETRVVSEAVEEVTEPSEDGTMEVVVQEYVPEVKELVRPYIPIEVTDEMIETKLEEFNEYAEYKNGLKDKAKEELVVEHNTVKYQGDPMSINFMSTVGAIGAMRMFQVLVQSGVITQEQYDSVYKTAEKWKGASNEIHDVQIEAVVEASELAMQELAKVIGVKE